MEKYYRKKIFTCKERNQNFQNGCDPEHIKQVNDFIISQINRKIVPFFYRSKKKSIETLNPDLNDSKAISQLNLPKKRKLSDKQPNLTDRKQLEDSHITKYEKLQEKVKRYIFEQKAINERREKMLRMRKVKKRNRKVIRSNDEVSAPNCFGNYFERLKYQMEEKERKKVENKKQVKGREKENRLERTQRNTDELSNEFHQGLIEYFYQPSRMKLRQSLGKKMLRRI